KIDKLNLRRRTDGTEFLFFNVILGDVYDAELILVGYDFEENRWITNNEKKLIAAFALIPGSANVAKKIGGEVIERIAKKGVAEEIIEEVSKETMEEMIEETSEEVVEKVVKESTNQLVKDGKDVFKKFDVSNAYVKPKHLSTTGGNGAKFLGDSKEGAEGILREAMKKGDIVDVLDNGLTRQGNQSYEIIINAGETIGTKGETLIKMVLSDDGGMLSAYPIK
ncbi:hypothetical protein, partial [Vallitalea sp.]|uniref:hypothetical protein n=1 Tax=Vallitalea sp. TaxID=1882829 RepID=UPI0025D61A37